MIKKLLENLMTLYTVILVQKANPPWKTHSEFKIFSSRGDKLFDKKTNTIIVESCLFYSNIVAVQLVSI